MKEVLQKIIAQSGYCSRRQAEQLIKKGRVKLNKTTAQLGERADLNLDKITIDDKKIKITPKKIYLKFNKPRGYTCSNRTFPGEKNIFQLINYPVRLFSVGRLDKDSCGLLLLTNDGAISQKLTHPKYSHEKKYLVTINKKLSLAENKKIEEQLRTGVDIGEGDGKVKVKAIKYLQNNVFSLTLTEGKKRQIRRMFKKLNLLVINLQRIEFAGIKLADLKEGEIRLLNKEELKLIK
ncbi:MAG: rRNA synthase [Patescibacteria group bacterium]|nr:rRNA synthase [Patescibacteria group bacterium]